MTAKQICSEHGLDFTISKRELFDSNNNPSGYFGLYNDKENICINSVKDSYHVSQNEDIVELVLEGMKPFGSQLNVTKAGSMNMGKKVFLQLGIEGDSHINGDTIKRFVTIIDSNDGSTALSIGIGDLTMSCSNQYYKFYKAGDAKFRHSASMQQKIKTIPMLITTALDESLKQMELYKQLSYKDVSKDLVHKMVKDLLGYDKYITSMEEFSKKSTRSINIMESLYNCIEGEMNDKGNTGWGLHSGITKFTTHEMSNPNRDNGKFETIMLGNGYKMNQNSLHFLEKELLLV